MGKAVTLQWQLDDGSEHVRGFNSLSEAREAIPSEAIDWVISRLVRKWGTGWIEVLDAIDSL